MSQTCRYRCIMGTDYYVTNEHLLRPDGATMRRARSSATT